MASDLRFIVSVIRVLSDLERMGDLSLRVVKLAPEQPVLASSPATFDILQTMADQAVDRFRLALRAWATVDLGLATELATGPTNDGAVPGAADGRAAEARGTGGSAGRGADASPWARPSTGSSTTRPSSAPGVRYMITGDPEHLRGRGALIERPMLRCSQRRPLTWRPWSTLTSGAAAVVVVAGLLVVARRSRSSPSSWAGVPGRRTECGSRASLRRRRRSSARRSNGAAARRGPERRSGAQVFCERGGPTVHRRASRRDHRAVDGGRPSRPGPSGGPAPEVLDLYGPPPVEPRAPGPAARRRRRGHHRGRHRAAPARGDPA